MYVGKRNTAVSAKNNCKQLTITILVQTCSVMFKLLKILIERRVARKKARQLNQ
jgi:hypothetical protein